MTLVLMLLLGGCGYSSPTRSDLASTAHKISPAAEGLNLPYFGGNTVVQGEEMQVLYPSDEWRRKEWHESLKREGWTTSAPPDADKQHFTRPDGAAFTLHFQNNATNFVVLLSPGHLP